MGPAQGLCRVLSPLAGESKSEGAEEVLGTLTSILSHRGRGSKKRIVDLGASVSWPVSFRLITNQASGYGGGT